MAYITTEINLFILKIYDVNPVKDAHKDGDFFLIKILEIPSIEDFLIS